MGIGRPVHFTDHALRKFEILRSHGVNLDRGTVERTLRSPDRVASGYGGRSIAQGSLDETRVLRVVYEDTADGMLVVTFYPGKRARYEQDPL